MTSSTKLLDRQPLIAVLERERAAGRSVALANGLFDLLHVGHLRYLEAAANEADLLVVAINNDDSARELKGPDRPLVVERERAELIAGFGCVDYVTIFPERTAEALLIALRPDVHCKGTDYTAEALPEFGTARELGIRVAIVGDRKEHATREMVRRIRDGEPGD